MAIYKLLAVTGTVLTTVVYTQYTAYCKDFDTHHPAKSKKSKAKLWDDNWDMMKPDESKLEGLTDDEKVGKISRAVRHIYLVRHGQYEIEETEPDKRILTELGRKQAELTGARLQEILGDSPTHCAISTYVRAMETGHIILKYLPKDIKVDYSEVIREGAPVPPVPENTYWVPEPYQFFQDGARIEAGFRKYIHRALPSQDKDSIEVIVCHGNVIRYFVCRALQNDPEGWLRMSLANASITHLVVKPSGHVTLRGLGEKGHIPSEFITYN